MTNLPTGTITFLFSDIEGSSRLWEHYPQAMQSALARHDTILREPILDHNGVVFKTVGDGYHAVFHRVMDAVAAALDAQRTLAAEAWGTFGLPPTEPLRVRMAIHTGVAELRDGDYFGSTLNRVARLMEAGHGGQILLSRASADLVHDLLPPDVTLRDLGSHELRNLSHPEQIFQLIAPDLPTPMLPLRTPPTQAAVQTKALPLLATKLYLPAPRATAVSRPRLIARLLRGLSSRLTLIAAPAGFGKSTLLAQALAARTEDRGSRTEMATPSLSPQSSALNTGVAWVALDEGDNDATRFWSYVCAALERASSGVGAPSLALLRAGSSQVEPALAELLNTLAEYAENIALILDDYHVITNPAIHEQISFLIDHAPPQFHLVIASRIDPPLPLPRWRVRGELTEIRAADLRFTSDEAVQFFAETMGIGLDAEAAAVLEARTEGWVAGLQLAALSLQGQADVRSFITSFSGSHRHVVDYLAEEVLGRQSAHIRAFLLQTAILERMCAELCDAVLGVGTLEPSNGQALKPANTQTAYSQLILDQLERANLFLILLDEKRRWYRYHHLFADLLRHRLHQEQPELVAELHRRAARWFEQHGTAAEAVEHALAANDTNLVVRLLTAHAARIAATGQTQTLQRWLDALPHEQLLSNPHLCLAQAQVLMLKLQVAAAEPYLDAAEQALTATEGPAALGLRGELLALRAHVAAERGIYADALSLAHQALTLLPAEEHWARSNCAFVLGYALYVLGHTTEAIAVLTENVRLCRTTGNIVYAFFSATEVTKLRVLQGRLAEARTFAEQALSWAADEGWEQLPPVSALHIWRGNVLLEQGDFVGAEAELAHAIRLTQHGPAIPAARAQIFLARLRQIHGDSEGANAALAAVEAIVSGWEPSGERAFFEAYTARVRLLQGDVATARRWASERVSWEKSERPSYFREIELLTLARVAVLGRSGSIDKAGLAETPALLVWLREHATAGGRGAVVIETLALEALALARAGEEAQAHERLGEALVHAAPEGFIGVFVDLGAPMADLLTQNLGRLSLSNDALRPYLTRLLRAFASGQPEQASQIETERRVQCAVGAASLEALTERELEVLRLFAAGMTSPEIAEHFVVSINTVKTQLKSIYSKLDAHSRAEAIAKARALHLLP
jgi:LuxR family maltose regulon positive regulatory protein